MYIQNNTKSKSLDNVFSPERSDFELLADFQEPAALIIKYLNLKHIPCLIPAKYRQSPPDQTLSQT